MLKGVVILRTLGLILGLFFLLSPLLGLVVSCSPSSLLSASQHPLFWPALTLSLSTSLWSLGIIVVITTPLAWHLAHTSSPFWQRVSRLLIDLPLILPPAVVGVSLLALWGSQGWGGAVLKIWNLHIPFTSLAVIIAQCVVAAPLYLQSAISSFKTLQPHYFEGASSLGASPSRWFSQCLSSLAACFETHSKSIFCLTVRIFNARSC